MALSLSNFIICCVFQVILLPAARAATHTLDWSIGWTTANPDGMMDRPTIGINGKWPLPVLEFTKGDTVVINAKNDLGNQTTSLHFHGLYMNGTNDMDGPVGVTQCPIPPGSSFVYNFTLEQTGTYWYHSHDSGQYPDGLRGPLIIHDPESPYDGQYDEELILTLSDWYHDQMPGLIKWFISVANPTGAEPVPDSALMNDTQNLQIPVEPNKTYLIHLANIGGFAGQYFWIEGHEFDIVEVDGIWTERATASQIYITAAQRYSILLTTKNDTSTNFAIVSSMDEDLFDTVPDTLNPNATSYLVYNSQAAIPNPSPIDAFDPFDDFTLVPYDKDPLLPSPDYSFSLDVVMDNLGDGANYAFFNNITYKSPTVPTLYSVLSAGPALATNPQIYGSATNTFVLSHNEVVEIVVNNHDTGKHPFHLHGHAFQAIKRSEDEAGDFDPNNATYPEFPMRRDVFMVRPDGHIVLRFRADNPGVWLFHCHIEWHVDSGLIATLVEAPLQLQSQFSSGLPSSHLQACAKNSPSMPTIGNAAGHGSNLSSSSPAAQNSATQQAAWLDLSGEPLPPARLPSGFTAKGYVAIVFSTLAAVLGLISIVWYGLGEIETGKQQAVVASMAQRVGE